MTTLPEPEDDRDRRALDNVERVGWHVLLVPEEDGTPGWGFSVGLFYSYQQPEVVTFGLPLATMHEMVNRAGELARDRRGLRAGLVSTDIVEGLPCEFREVHANWHRPLLGYAQWFYRRSNFPALQCLWPDRAGRLPSDPQCDPEVLRLQPNLASPDADVARMVAILGSMDG